MDGPLPERRDWYGLPSIQTPPRRQPVRKLGGTRNDAPAVGKAAAFLGRLPVWYGLKGYGL